METWIRTGFDTLSLTSIFILLVLGMAVIVSMMGVFNLAHGEFVLLGAGCAVVSDRWFGTALWGIVLAPLLLAGFGALLERTLVCRLYRRPESALLATFAVGLIIREIVRSQMKIQAVTVDAPITGTWSLLGAELSLWRLVLIVLTPIIIGVCAILLRGTDFGLQVRATLDNPALAESSGIATGRTYAISFAFGSALAGLAGALIAPVLSFYPDLGVGFVIRSFVSVMLGGIGTFAGPITGAAATGIPTGLLPRWLSGSWPDVVVIGAAVVLVRIRPAGLITRKGST